MRIERLSSITRSIDLNYPTNRIIVEITLLFLLGTAGFQLILGKAISSALYSGLIAGASVFLAWAFARELDPDNELSAFFAAFWAAQDSCFFLPLFCLLSSWKSC